MSLSAAEQLIVDFEALQLNLLKPIKLTLQQAKAILQFRQDHNGEHFLKAFPGGILAHFKECQAQEIMAWARAQNEFHSNERANMFDSEDCSVFEHPHELDQYTYRFRQDIDQLISTLVPGTYVKEGFCESGLTSEARVPQLHIDLTAACSARLGDLPLMILNPERLDDAVKRVRVMHNEELSEEQRRAAKNSIWLLTAEQTARLCDEGLLVPAPLGSVSLNLTGTSKEFEDKLRNGLPHASSVFEEPTHSVFLFARIRNLYTTPRPALT